MGRKNRKHRGILKEAQEVADAYLRTSLLIPERRLRKIPAAVYAGGGAALAGAVWLALRLFGVI